jgi:hypothetical protein
MEERTYHSVYLVTGYATKTYVASANVAMLAALFRPAGSVFQIRIPNRSKMYGKHSGRRSQPKPPCPDHINQETPGMHPRDKRITGGNNTLKPELSVI